MRLAGRACCSSRAAEVPPGTHVMSRARTQAVCLPIAVLGSSTVVSPPGRLTGMTAPSAAWAALEAVMNMAVLRRPLRLFTVYEYHLHRGSAGPS